MRATTADPGQEESEWAPPNNVAHQRAWPMDPSVVCIKYKGARTMMVRMYRAVTATAALVRNAGQRTCEILSEGSVPEAENGPKSWRLATPLSIQKNGNLALDAQVHLWIERNSTPK